jgi:hypothetical protein
MKIRRVYGGVLVVAAFTLMTAMIILLSRPSAEPNISRPELVHAFDTSSGFRFRYPDGWDYSIPLTNLLYLAGPDALRGQPGPTFTVQRSLRLTAEEDTLEGALDTYLQRGPLRPDRFWDVVDETKPITFDGREALIIELEGAEGLDAPPLHTRIIIAYADNRMIYVFVGTAPVEQWDSYIPTFEAIFASVEILE